MRVRGSRHFYRSYPVTYDGDPKSLSERERDLWPWALLILGAVVLAGTVGAVVWVIWMAG